MGKLEIIILFQYKPLVIQLCEWKTETSTKSCMSEPLPVISQGPSKNRRLALKWKDDLGQTVVVVVSRSDVEDHTRSDVSVSPQTPWRSDLTTSLIVVPRVGIEVLVDTSFLYGRILS